MNRHMWPVWLWQLQARFWGRLGGCQGARGTEVQPSKWRFNGQKPSFGTELFRFTSKYNALTYTSLYLQKGEIQSPFGSCWLRFDGRMREQGEFHGSSWMWEFDGLKLCSPQQSLDVLRAEGDMEGCLLMSNILIQKQNQGPNSASHNNLWANHHLHCGHGVQRLPLNGLFRCQKGEVLETWSYWEIVR